MTLESEKLTITVDGHTLVHDASIHCEPGQVVALLGPNGAGKSTLLGGLAGHRNTSGTVRLDGRELGEWNAGELARCRGVLRQRSHLPFGFKVREVVEMGETPWRTAGPGVGSQPSGLSSRERAMAYLESVGLESFADRQYPTLSGGEKRRVQLARVMVQIRALEQRQRPSYLMLDEPLASLDIAESARVLGRIRALGRSGVGVLCVFHDLNAAASVADRVVLMRGGEVVAMGPARATMSAEGLRACFGAPVSVSWDARGAPMIRAQLTL
jgi:iron complex transport system ATP-binding protein